MAMTAFYSLLGVFALFVSANAKVPLAKDHIMIQAGMEKSKAAVVKKKAPIEFDEDDEVPTPEDRCANMAQGTYAKGSCKQASPAPAKPKVEVAATPAPAQSAQGASRLQKGTVMKKVMILDEDDE